MLLSLRALLPSMVRWICIFSTFFRTGTTVIPERTNGYCTISKYIKNTCFPEGVSEPLQGVALRIAEKILMKWKVWQPRNQRTYYLNTSSSEIVAYFKWHNSYWKRAFLQFGNDKMLYACSGVWLWAGNVSWSIHKVHGWFLREEKW